jgi:hypothetical protein
MARDENQQKLLPVAASFTKITAGAGKKLPLPKKRAATYGAQPPSSSESQVMEFVLENPK